MVGEADIRCEVPEAIAAGNKGRAAQLLDASPALLNAKAEDGVSAVSVAVCHGRRDIADLFVERGTRLNIFEAAALGNLQRVRELAEADALFVNARSSEGFQPSGLACFFAHENAVRYLPDAGAAVNSPSRNAMQVQPIHSAAASRGASIVRLPIEHGADPNARQHGGYAPVDAALQNGDTERLEVLGAAGAAVRS